MALSVNILSISRRHTVAAVSCYTHREYSNNVKVSDNTLPSLKRGTGGRSSFNGIVATVFGATGCFGRFVVNTLGKCGTQVIIPYRSEPDDENVKSLKLFGDLGQILFQPFDLRDPVSIRKCIKYSNVVINLIGSHFETRNFSFEKVNVQGARAIAQACREFNIDRLIHISSLNVTHKPVTFLFPKSFDYLPSKLRGEEAVFDEVPHATIFRPSLMFGMYDRFIWALVSQSRRTGKSIPLWEGGKKTVKQPVYLQDVADGILAAIHNKDSKGKIYQAVGPERYLLCDIADYIGRIVFCDDVTYHHDARFDPYFWFKLFASRYGYAAMSYSPLENMCLEQLETEAISDEVNSGLPLLEDLGIKLTKLEEKTEELVRLRTTFKSAQYTESLEYSKVKPPPVYDPFFA